MDILFLNNNRKDGIDMVGTMTTKEGVVNSGISQTGKFPNSVTKDAFPVHINLVVLGSFQ